MPPPVHCRLREWVRYKDKVIVIIVKGGAVSVIGGHISSHPTSGEKIADNVTRTAVWGERRFDPCGESGDDAYEMDFKVNDPNLLKVPEAEILQDERLAIEWFRGAHPKATAIKIAKALRDRFSKKA